MITEFSLLGDPSFLIHIFTEILKYFCYFFNLKGGRGFKKQRWKNMHKMRKKTLQKMRLIRKWEDLYRPSSKVNKSLLIRQFYLFNFLWEANAYSSCKMSQTVIPQNLIIFTIYITYNKIYLSIFKIIIQMYDLCIFFFYVSWATVYYQVWEEQGGMSRSLSFPLSPSYLFHFHSETDPDPLYV